MYGISVTASQCAKNGVVSLCCSKFGQRKGTPSHLTSSAFCYIYFSVHTLIRTLVQLHTSVTEKLSTNSISPKMAI